MWCFNCMRGEMAMQSSIVKTVITASYIYIFMNPSQGYIYEYIYYTNKVNGVGWWKLVKTFYQLNTGSNYFSWLFVIIGGGVVEWIRRWITKSTVNGSNPYVCTWFSALMSRLHCIHRMCNRIEAQNRDPWPWYWSNCMEDCPKVVVKLPNQIKRTL